MRPWAARRRDKIRRRTAAQVRAVAAPARLTLSERDEKIRKSFAALSATARDVAATFGGTMATAVADFRSAIAAIPTHLQPRPLIHSGPPDYCEPVLAYRAWTSTSGHLEALHVFGLWPARQVRRAADQFDRALRLQRCTSDGYYACKALSRVCRHLFHVQRPVVLGAVWLWGAVLEYQHGYRAEYAYPACLFAFPSSIDLETISRIAAEYGVPVVTLSADFNESGLDQRVRQAWAEHRALRGLKNT